MNGFEQLVFVWLLFMKKIWVLNFKCFYDGHIIPLLSIICEIMLLYDELRKLLINEKWFDFGMICIIISFGKMTIFALDLWICIWIFHWVKYETSKGIYGF